MSTKGLNSVMVIFLQTIQTFAGHCVRGASNRETHTILSSYSKPFSKRFFYETKPEKLKVSRNVKQVTLLLYRFFISTVIPRDCWKLLQIKESL